MNSVTIEEAQARLPILIDQLGSGEELLILRDDEAVAKLVGRPRPKRLPRQPGSAVGVLTILAEDDEHLDSFREYMP